MVKGVLDRGYDVLLLTQDVDEFTFQAMREYVAADMPKIYEDDAAREAAEKAVADGAEPEVEDRHLELKNVATGDLDLATEDEKKEAEDATKENARRKSPIRRTATPCRCTARCGRYARCHPV